MALAASLAIVAFIAPARAEDGYSSAFAQAVRAATQPYRLVVWARNDQYIQSTDFVGGIGMMYTNHERFNPPDLGHPSMLVYDEGGRLVACGYQFTPGTPYPPDFASVPASAWYNIARHVHYNAREGKIVHYAQAPWEGDEQPTADVLRTHGLLPNGATLDVAFVHPATRAILVWAWLPNQDGLFAGENALLP